jgi:hypothetical protein
MGFRKSATERREATAKAARDITTIFWAGSGSETSLLDAEAEIRALKLTPDQLRSRSAPGASRAQRSPASIAF